MRTASCRKTRRTCQGDFAPTLAQISASSSSKGDRDDKRNSSSTSSSSSSSSSRSEEKVVAPAVLSTKQCGERPLRLSRPDIQTSKGLGLKQRKGNLEASTTTDPIDCTSSVSPYHDHYSRALKYQRRARDVPEGRELKLKASLNFGDCRFPHTYRATRTPLSSPDSEGSATVSCDDLEVTASPSPTVRF